MSLLVTIERHLRRRSVPPSRFGRDATGDPRFVFDLRRGREPRPETRARVLAYIARCDDGLGMNTRPAMLRAGTASLSGAV